jgi:hypothetical protein
MLCEKHSGDRAEQERQIHRVPRSENLESHARANYRDLGVLASPNELPPQTTNSAPVLTVPSGHYSLSARLVHSRIDQSIGLA